MQRKAEDEEEAKVPVAPGAQTGKEGDYWDEDPFEGVDGDWMSSPHPYWAQLPEELRGYGTLDRLHSIGSVLKNFNAFYVRTGKGVWWRDGYGDRDPSLIDPGACWDYWLLMRQAMKDGPDRGGVDLFGEGSPR